MRTTLSMALVLAASTNCGDPVRDACERIAACDARGLPIHTAVLCDHSRASGCTRETLGATIASVAHRSAGHPGSRIDVWFLGRDAGATRLHSSYSVRIPDRQGPRALREHEAAEMTAALAVLVDSVEFGPPPDRSPIIDAIGKLSLAGFDEVAEAHLVVVGDALAYSPGHDFECGRLPDEQTLIQSVFEGGALAPESLSGVAVQFVYVDLGAIDRDRCLVDLGRTRIVRKLWTTLLSGAGASSVSYSAGPPVFTASRHKGMEDRR